MEERRHEYPNTLKVLAQLPQTLPAKPAAVLIISGHWEEPQFTVCTGARPPMLYDYTGFPAHTYQIRYPAPGAPALASRAMDLIRGAGLSCGEDAHRGFDHGTFIPLGLIFPGADVPVLMVSMQSSYDPLQHVKLGQALAPLRDEGVLIIGSGLSFHNMRAFRHPAAGAVSEQFEQYLYSAVADPAHRIERLVNWAQEPSGRLCHPREDHLVPLFAAAGAAGDSPGERLIIEHAMGVTMASYRFG
ncbi:Aromatic ring-opening dioxygenase, catalytic subunit, LigB family [Noviherbaspirillum humi]|uniref:Aromatic ring-opening dioxygenase, catalytic subunit, LigB family n=2 Tax=Noviherbaspirillum humi TaxID=1688639 RepID=A0A239FCU7_9BURK|nr:Aromatic ring-opening dioxygenase, catalytic subunit, LigB family [Noviherbaspirillum humi]